MARVGQVIDIYRGDSATVFVDLDAADGTSFDPAVPGIDIEWRMMTSPYGRTLIRKTMSEGGLQPVTGGVEIILSPDDTDQQAGIYYHAMRVFDPDSDDIATVMTGTVRIRPAPRWRKYISPASASLALSVEAPGVA
jgi:hypothetical protein